MGFQRRIEELLSRLLIYMDWSIGQSREKARQRMLSDFSSEQLPRMFAYCDSDRLLRKLETLNTIRFRS
jgi:hypothetical protein